MTSSSTQRTVIVGAGPVGRETARVLTEQGHEVTAVTRSGRPSAIDGVRSIALDATDSGALTRTTDGAAALVNCANPGDYTMWEEFWPPLASSLLRTAERTGATLVTTGNLYPYGPVDVALTEDLPDAATDHKGRLRARMWADAKAAHDAGRLHAVEVRGSDYLGTGVGRNGHVSRQLPTAREGKAAWMIGDPDRRHTFTDVRDMGRALAAVAFAPQTWGQLWHAPSAAPSTQRDALNGALAAIGKPPVAVHGIPVTAVKALGLAVPMLREIGQLGYMFTRDYVLDSTKITTELGLEPSSWEDTLRRTAESS